MHRRKDSADGTPAIGLAHPATAAPLLQGYPDPEAAVLARNGISRVPAFQYHVDGYRYGNLADALAQVARRSRSERGEA